MPCQPAAQEPIRVGTVLQLDQHPPRQADANPNTAPVSVTAFGFCIGPTFVPWQAVSMIHASRIQAGTCDDVLLEFDAHGHCLPVRAGQPGFAALELAMLGAFPDTAGWREALQGSQRPRGRTLLYRRP